MTSNFVNSLGTHSYYTLLNEHNPEKWLGRLVFFHEEIRAYDKDWDTYEITPGQVGKITGFSNFYDVYWVDLDNRTLRIAQELIEKEEEPKNGTFRLESELEYEMRRVVNEE